MSSPTTVTQRIIASNHNYYRREVRPCQLSHKESLHQITTAMRSTHAAIDCHTKNHCIKSQHKSGGPGSPTTVTQRIIASNHNCVFAHIRHLSTVTQRIIASNHNSSNARSRLTILSHKESLHQITTQASKSLLPSNCHTKNHCIKSQLFIGEPVRPDTVTQRIIASNHNEAAQICGEIGTVTQRIIASNHNNPRALQCRSGTVTQRIIASNHNKKFAEEAAVKLSHKESLHQITT